jgi:hypothetical protein
MTCKQVLTVVLLGAAVLAAGCKSSTAVKDVIALRKAGQPGDAREKAVAELTNDAGSLALWRELAMTDVTLSESRFTRDLSASVRYLNEGALICAAVYEYKGQKLDEKWLSVATQAVQHTVALADRVISTVNVETVRGHTRLKAAPLTDVELEDERFIDPDEMEKTVRRAIPLIFFTERLGQLVSTGIGGNVEELNKRIMQMGQNSNLSDRMVEGRCRVYTDRVAQCLTAAEQDLKENGYFKPETIFENPIIETP